MKRKILAFAVLSCLAFLSACTFQSMLLEPPKGRVIFGSSVGPGDKPQPERMLRPKHSPLARSLSDSPHIESMSYTLVHIGSGEAAVTGPIDPLYPSLELFLTPGASYRITIDVVLKDYTTTNGVTGFGDQIDFMVDPDYDTYVNLNVHPNRMLVIDPASLSTGFKGYYPYASEYGITQGEQTVSSATGTMRPRDKFFYGPDAQLYYLNTDVSRIYEWSDLAGIPEPIVSGDDFNFYVEDSYEILAAAADPLVSGAFYVIVEQAGSYYYTWIIAGEANTYWDWYSDITAEVTGGGTPTEVVVTGITADQDGWSYVSYYNYDTNTDTIHSGVLQLDYYGYLYESFPENYDGTNVPLNTVDLAGDNRSIYTDVMWDQGKLWVLAAPNMLSVGDMKTGRADILVFDGYLTPLETIPTSRNVDYTGTLPETDTADVLFLPNRFAGPIQGSMLYFSQWTYDTYMQYGDEVLSSINLTDDAINDVTAKFYILPPPPPET